MKILMLEWKSFGNEDIAAAFKELGHEVKAVPFSNKELHHDEEEEKKLVSMIREFSPDFLFSFNYFPIVSLACKKADMRYVCWVYDSPYVMLYSYTIAYPGNYVFVFDKEVYFEFHNAGINTIYYLPSISADFPSKNGLRTPMGEIHPTRFHPSVHLPCLPDSTAAYI